MKKNVCIRMDEELIALVDDYRALYERIYHIDMNQTVAMEALLKSGIKSHIRLLKGMMESSVCEDECEENIKSDLDKLADKFANYTSKGKNK